MKRVIIIAAIILTFISAYSQNEKTDNWRQLGYQAKIDKNYNAAIDNYEKIMDFDSTDYDARLALARLYTLIEDYEKAIDYYTVIFDNDSTDVEALNGLGECYTLTGNDEKAIRCYEFALFYQPSQIMQYFYLAGAYGNGGELEKAIMIYQKINIIDSTYSEAWAGMGKMYYWMGKPKTASVYYKKALGLDPENEEITGEYLNIQRDLNYGLSIQTGPIQEKEESYEINALITRIKLEKRFSDHLYLEANFLLDYSNRVFSNHIGDTTRWFNSSWIKGGYVSEHHTFSAYFGYSNTDNKVSTYGLNWKLNYNVKKFTFKNIFNAGYDYYYYWNRVGAKSVSDELNLGYSIVGLNVRYSYGLVDAVYTVDPLSEDTGAIRQNPYQTYSLSVTAKVLKKPEIIVGLNHSFLDYTYKSPLYYSPFSRKLTGASVSLNYSVRSFYTYVYFSYNLGTEENYEVTDDLQSKTIEVNVNNWSSSVELGYNYYPFVFSIGGSNFYNPYYQNLTGFVSIKVYF